jgi:hypothetical protein
MEKQEKVFQANLVLFDPFGEILKDELKYGNLFRKHSNSIKDTRVMNLANDVLVEFRRRPFPIHAATHYFSRIDFIK